MIGEQQVFPTSEDSHVAEIIDNAPAQVRACFGGLVRERRAKAARSHVRQSEMAELKHEAAQLEFIVSDIDRQVQKYGHKPGRTFETTNKKGEVSTEFVEDPTIEKQRTRLATINARIRELGNESAQKTFDALASVTSKLAEFPRNLILEADELPEVSEFEDQDPEQAFVENFKKTAALHKATAKLWDAPRTNDEIKASVTAEVEAAARRGVVDIGGHARGYGMDFFGNQIVDNPDARLRWPSIVKELPQMNAVGVLQFESLDSEAMFARLFKDQILADLFAQIDAKFPDGNGAISAAEKKAKLAAAEAELWAQHRLTEAWFRVARDTGSKLIRAEYTPFEIILGAKKIRRNR